MNSPFVSVIIPTFNHSRYVCASVDSALSQTYVQKEIIVINDGSTDETKHLLSPYISAGLIRYYEQPNSGVACTRNVGIGLSSGEYLAFLDDDDIWPPDKLEWQVEMLSLRNDAVALFGRGFVLGSETDISSCTGSLSEVSIREHLRGCLFLSPGQMLVRKEALIQSGGFSTDVWGADDWDVYLKLGRLGRVLLLDRAALFYRVHESNSSKNYWPHYLASIKVYRRHSAYGQVGLFTSKVNSASRLQDHFAELAWNAMLSSRGLLVVVHGCRFLRISNFRGLLFLGNRFRIFVGKCRRIV